MKFSTFNLNLYLRHARTALSKGTGSYDALRSDAALNQAFAEIRTLLERFANGHSISSTSDNTSLRSEKFSQQIIPPLSNKLKSANKLFSLLSCRTDLDHPLGTECTDGLLKTHGEQLKDTMPQETVGDLCAKASSSRQKADEARASQAASSSQNRVLDGLMRLKNSGRILGFHGRLGSLGTIPEKYDVAISTACPGLNILVDDTVDQGQACIEYLRKQNLGRTSFIVLEKLSQTNGLEKIQMPENVPRLMDLIQPRERHFAPAFFNAVGNTLVANDLEQANRIVYGQRRWRVVTLTGQLIDTSGTMSGGGMHVTRGVMSSKLAADAVSPDVLHKYEQESEDVVKKLEIAIELF